FGAKHGRVQALIPVRFRYRDEIPESFGERLVEIGDDRVDAPAVLFPLLAVALQHDADGEEVVDLVDRLVLALHLAPDRIDVFRTTVDLELEFILLETLAKRLDEALDVR